MTVPDGKVSRIASRLIGGHEFLRALGWLCSRCGKPQPLDADGRKLFGRHVPRCLGPKVLQS